MNYISQALDGNEKLVALGRFHWIYYAGAVFWLVLGVLLCIGIMTGAVVWDIWSDVKATYPTLPADMFHAGWDNILISRGGYLAVIRGQSGIVRGLAFAGLLLGLALFAHMMAVRLTTEIGVTTTRLILKEGIIARNVDEMNIDRIESVHVLQSMIGRIFGFGTVMVRGMGVGEIVMPPMADPLAFRNALERARQYYERTRRS